MSKNTMLDGVASSSHVDSSGESLNIKGMNIESLGSADSILNWEHKGKESPSQVIGKVTFAKKILKKEDAKNKREKYWWNKIKKEFVYVKAELFDGLGHSGAKDVAAMLKYNNKDKGEDSRLVVGFSIEGGTMDKKGMVVTKSIGGDIAITVKPCNKICLVEVIENVDNNDDFLYKNEEDLSINPTTYEVFVKKENVRDMLLGDMKKAALRMPTSNMRPAKRPRNTAPDKFSTPKYAHPKAAKPSMAERYKDKTKKLKEDNSFKEKQDKTGDIKKLANKPIVKPEGSKHKEMGSPKTPQDKLITRKFSEKKAPTNTKVGDRVTYKKNPDGRTGKDIYNDPDTFKTENNMRKALVAGIMNAAPSSLSGVAALSPENLMGTMQDVTDKKKKNKKKDKKIEKGQAELSFDKLAGKSNSRMNVKTDFNNPFSAMTTQNTMKDKNYDPDAEGEAGAVVGDKAFDFNNQNQSKEEMKETKGRGNYPSTVYHEGFHRHVNKIGDLTSPEHAQSLVRHMLDNHFGLKDRMDVSDYVKSQGYEEHINEESVTHMLDLITNPDKKDDFHKVKDLGEEGNRSRMNRIKSGWKKAVASAKNISREDLENIHNDYLEKDKKIDKKVKIQRFPPGKHS